MSAWTIASRPTACTSALPVHSTTSNRSSMAAGRSAHKQRWTAIASPSRRNRAAATSTIAWLPSAARTLKPRRASTAASIPVPQAASSTVAGRADPLQQARRRGPVDRGSAGQRAVVEYPVVVGGEAMVGVSHEAQSARNTGYLRAGQIAEYDQPVAAW